MSAPTSGSSGSSPHSASPVPGYYPDPSIPHYIRYWNGSAWVPGTSRPVDDGPAPVPGPAVIPAPAPPAPAPPAPAVDESGPVYLDEDPRAPRAEGPASAAAAGHRAALPPAPAPASPVDELGPVYLDEDPRAPLAGTSGPAWPVPRTGEPPRISWGSPEPDPRPDSQSARPRAVPQARQAPPPYAQPIPPVQPVPQPLRPAPAEPAQPSAPQPQPQPQSPAQPQPQSPAQPLPQARPQPLSQYEPPPAAPQSGAPWAARVHDLARQGEPQGAAGPAAPWRPVAADPFAGALRSERPGGLVRRFAARVVDTVVASAVVGAAALPLGSAAYHHAKDKVDAARLTGETVRVYLIDGTTGVQLGAVLVVAVAAGLLLEVLPTVKWGRTLGKKLVGLRVLDIEAQTPPRFGASLRRWLTRAVLDVLVVGALGLLWCLFDRPWKQCWHDKAARTFVAGG
ncbi:RDD family protein [Actinacidiphila sp. ITFR-21]|uniref:RDD family protein n=1 Tax=Actinacidiphila sp. ITFR-21 TaxID=3075199 RepID=UPI00288A54AE|nr:RDD family protein [Streptomyces sp. ITFR-21]WNI15707.1 RDD family protein [Streptomyces sp. ITFR-21]